MSKTPEEIVAHLNKIKPIIETVKPLFSEYVNMLYSISDDSEDTLVSLYCISFAIVLPDTSVDSNILLTYAAKYIDKDIDFQFSISVKDKRTELKNTAEYMHKWIENKL
jgi:hypothetical protein